MATAVNPYHDRRTGERRRFAYPGLFNAEGIRVSWGGIFGGVLVAVGLLLLLAALGVAVGISAVQPTQTELARVGAGAGIWAGVSLLIALFVGGFVSTRIGATHDPSTGFFAGFLVWVVSLLLVAYLAASGVSSLAGGAFSLMGGAQQVMQQVEQQAQHVQQNLPQLQQKAEEVKPQASRAAWATFGALILSLVAAVLGAVAGRRRYYPSSRGT